MGEWIVLYGCSSVGKRIKDREREEEIKRECKRERNICNGVSLTKWLKQERLKVIEKWNIFKVVSITTL